MNRLDLPMTQSEGMLLWGVLERLLAPNSGGLTADEQVELGWVRQRLATLCTGTSVLTPPDVDRKPVLLTTSESPMSGLPVSAAVASTRRQRLRAITERIKADLDAGQRVAAHVVKVAALERGTCEGHTFVPVAYQTGCGLCGFARGHHPKTVRG